MPVSDNTNPENTLCLDLSRLPAYRFADGQRIDLQIAAHLQKTLAYQGTGPVPTVHLPSVMNLAGFYHCSVLDVLDGLFQLKNQNYAYAMKGLDDEIILQDPLDRESLFFNHTPGLFKELLPKKAF